MNESVTLCSLPLATDVPLLNQFKAMAIADVLNLWDCFEQRWVVGGPTLVRFEENDLLIQPGRENVALVAGSVTTNVEDLQWVKAATGSHSLVAQSAPNQDAGSTPEDCYNLVHESWMTPAAAAAAESCVSWCPNPAHQAWIGESLDLPQLTELITQLVRGAE